MTGTGGTTSRPTVVRPFAETYAAHLAELDEFRRAIRMRFWEQWQREVIREVQQSHPAHPVETFEDAVSVLLRHPPQGPDG